MGKKNKIVTKNELGRMIAAFCADDIEYIKNELLMNKYTYYETHMYKRFPKKLMYYAITNVSEKTLDYLLEKGINLTLDFEMISKINHKKRMLKFLDFLCKKSNDDLKKLFSLDYSNIITTVCNLWCNRGNFQCISDFEQYIDVDRFDYQKFKIDIQYRYQNNTKAKVWIRHIKLKELEESFEKKS